MAKIQVLDKQTAELIAAGEVVERPSSVIKELMENAIDAGSSHIVVEIRDGGITYMRVTDNGCGITREDVATAFLRHATSKVHTAADLSAIGTLGFRGEALASIAAVAQVDLTTCARGELVGTHYSIRGGEEQVTEDAGCPEGATFEIRDLFYNIPARMKFLKKDVSEGNAVAGVVERLALSHPEISVKFIRNGRVELQTPGNGETLPCIHAVFGKPFAAGLIPVEYTQGGVSVQGYICKPEACRQNRTMQHFFVNGRYVKTQTAAVALERAYKGVMMAGRFPTCVLFLTMPPETVDANVHPAKIEVRFINEKPVFDAVYFGVKSGIEQGDGIRRVLLRQEAAPPVSGQAVDPVRPAPAKTTVTDITHSAVMPQEMRRPAAVQTPPAVKVPSFLDLCVDEEEPPKTATLEDGTIPAYRRTELPPVPSVPAVDPVPETPSPDAPASETSTPAQEQLCLENREEPLRFLGEFAATYILVQRGDSLFIIDKHAAHERILYNRLKATGRSDSQLLLTPVPVSVSAEEHTALLENIDVLAQFGMEMEDFGSHTVLVRSFPMTLSGEDIDGTVREIATGLAKGSREVTASKLDWVYHSSACRAATKAGDRNSPEELTALAETVLTDETVRYCPHGRPVCIEMTKKDLEKQFGRLL